MKVTPSCRDYLTVMSVPALQRRVVDAGVPSVRIREACDRQIKRFRRRPAVLQEMRSRTRLMISKTEAFAIASNEPFS